MAEMLRVEGRLEPSMLALPPLRIDLFFLAKVQWGTTQVG